MKKSVTSIIIAVLTALQSALAQPTLTQWQNFTLGQSEIYLITADTSIHEGAGGAMQNWNFSSLMAQDTVEVNIVSPSSTPYASTFPTAVLAEQYDNGIYHFINTAGNMTDLVGFVDINAGLEITYPNSWVVAKRPFQFNDAYVDTLTRTYTSGGLNFNGLGICTITADAYGTLNLPSGTYNNVLRIKIDQQNSDTCSLGILDVHYSSYRFYEANGVFPLLRIDEQIITSSLFNDYSKTTWFKTNSTTGIADSNPFTNLTAFTDGQGFIRLNTANHTENFLVKCFDLNGRTIFEKRISSGENHDHTFSCDATGMLFLVVCDTGNCRTQTFKIIKQN